MKIFQAIVILSVLILVSGCTSQPADEKIKIGLQLTPASALVQIADEKGFFKKNGVDVEIQEFTAGKFAFQAMLAKSVDFAVVGDIPVMLAKSQGNDFYIVAEVSGNANEAPVIVRDDGSGTFPEFFSKKRKIATSPGGTPEYSLYLFFRHYGVPKENIEVIPLKPEEMVGAFSSGSVDAIAIFEPYPLLTEENNPGKTLRFDTPEGLYVARFPLAADKKFVDENPEAAKNIVKALAEAREFVKNNPEETKAIVAKRTKFSRNIIDKIWKDYIFSVQITPELLQNLEREYQWAVETGKIKENGEVDFRGIMRYDIAEAD